MKKLIVDISGLLLAGVLLYACQKQSEAAGNVPAQEKVSPAKLPDANTTKSLNGASNPNFLLAAARGDLEQFRDPNDLEELLSDHLPLQTEVLIQLIRNENVPDDLIELTSVLSCPVNQSVIAMLKQERPGLILTNILENQSRMADQQFYIVHTNPKTIISGKELVKSNPNLECGDCSSVIEGSPDSKLIRLIAGSGSDRTKKACNSNLYICGYPVRVVRKDGSRPTRPTFEVQCDASQPDVICIGGGSLK